MKLKSLFGTVVVAGISLAGLGVAHADQLYNDVDDSIDAAVESIVMELGDAPESVGLYLKEQNATQEGAGGESGCNLKGGRQLVLDIVNSNSTAVTVASTGSSVYNGDSNKVLITGDCSEDGTQILKATLSVTANSGTPLGSPAVITFTRNSASTALGNTALDTASFDVTVTVPVETVRRGAPAVANEYLSNQVNTFTDTCKVINGTNKNQANWHGQLISKIAHQFQGEYSASEEALIIAAVNELCGQ